VAGCGGDEEIARVGDTEFHLSDIDPLFESGAVPGEDFRVVLYRIIAVEVLNQSLAADYGVAVQPEQIEAHLANLEAALEQSGQTPAEYLGMEGLSREMLRFNAEVMALRDLAIDELLADPEVVDGLFADPAALTTVCSRHILVATEEEAAAAAARLAAGEDFAAVAEELSLDTNSEGGDLGCLPASTFVDEFAEAVVAGEIGEVTGPVETEYGFHLVLVYERTAPSREEFLADPRSAISTEVLADVWSNWFNTELGAADVWLSPDYGTWYPGGIVAPSAGE
jgi:parvulin-like peptidyl-prolyl isomerase